jgi:hypothetical protein
MLTRKTLTSRAMPTRATTAAKTWSTMLTEGRALTIGAAVATGAAALGTAAGTGFGAAAGAADGAAAAIAAGAGTGAGAAAVCAVGAAAGVGSLIAGVAVGFGGKLMRTVSFLGWTLAGSSGLGGTAPDGKLGMFSAITFLHARFGKQTCQTL